MYRESIRALIADAFSSARSSGALPEIEMPPIELARPKLADHGDFSCNIALITASAIRNASGEKSNPRALATAIVDAIAQSEIISAIEIAGPGFINMHLNDAWIQRQVGAVIDAGPDFGNLSIGRGQKWQVEFVSANPCGPIHYGGARNAVLGDAISNVLAAAGYTVQREFYINDYGTQFALFVETVYARYAQLLGQDIAVPEDGYQGDYVIDYAQQIIDAEGDRFLHMERSAAIMQLRAPARTIVLDALEAELSRIGVHFDRWFSEESLHKDGLVEEALDYLRGRDEIVERDGAIWFRASKYANNEKDAVVIRSNGAPTYFASDIAYHYNKFITRQFDHVVNVWAVDHQGHIPRMNAVMQAFGLEAERLTILMYDLVRLNRDGQEVKLSKRAGNLVTIDDVAGEVGADALRFNLLTRAPESTIDFDLALAVAQNSENPVCSIVEKAAEELDYQTPATTGEAEQALLTRLDHPAELALIRKILELEEQIELAVDKLSPHNLTHYAIELAKSFNGFYRDCLVVDAEYPERSRARLLLCEATRIALAKVFILLGISAPTSM